MEAKFSHTLDTVSFSIVFRVDDFQIAFYDQADPDEILYYKIQTPAALNLPVPEQLELLLKFARLVIGDPAVNMAFTDGTVTNK